jgi:hypothetical protein
MFSKSESIHQRITKWEKLLWFHSENCHSTHSNFSKTTPQLTFSQGFIYLRLWPPGSSNFNALSYHWRGKQINRFYVNTLRFAKTENNIQTETANISGPDLHHVKRNIFSGDVRCIWELEVHTMTLYNETRISLTTEEKHKISGMHCLAQGHLLGTQMCVCAHAHACVHIFYIPIHLRKTDKQIFPFMQM